MNPPSAGSVEDVDVVLARVGFGQGHDDRLAGSIDSMVGCQRDRPGPGSPVRTMGAEAGATGKANADSRAFPSSGSKASSRGRLMLGFLSEFRRVRPAAAPRRRRGSPSISDSGHSVQDNRRRSGRPERRSRLCAYGRRLRADCGDGSVQVAGVDGKRRRRTSGRSRTCRCENPSWQPAEGFGTRGL